MFKCLGNMGLGDLLGPPVQMGHMETQRRKKREPAGEAEAMVTTDMHGDHSGPRPFSRTQFLNVEMNVSSEGFRMRSYRAAPHSGN